MIASISMMFLAAGLALPPGVSVEHQPDLITVQIALSAADLMIAEDGAGLDGWSRVSPGEGPSLAAAEVLIPIDADTAWSVAAIPATEVFSLREVEFREGIESEQPLLLPEQAQSVWREELESRTRKRWQQLSEAPWKPVEVLSEAWIGHQRFLHLRLRPLRYLPADFRIEMLSNAAIEIKLESTAKTPERRGAVLAVPPYSGAHPFF